MANLRAKEALEEVTKAKEKEVTLANKKAKEAKAELVRA